MLPAEQGTPQQPELWVHHPDVTVAQSSQSMSAGAGHVLVALGPSPRSGRSKHHSCRGTSCAWCPLPGCSLPRHPSQRTGCHAGVHTVKVVRATLTPKVSRSAGEPWQLAGRGAAGTRGWRGGACQGLVGRARRAQAGRPTCSPCPDEARRGVEVARVLRQHSPQPELQLVQERS